MPPFFFDLAGGGSQQCERRGLRMSEAWNSPVSTMVTQFGFFYSGFLTGGFQGSTYLQHSNQHGDGESAAIHSHSKTDNFFGSVLHFAVRFRKSYDEDCLGFSMYI